MKGILLEKRKLKPTPAVIVCLLLIQNVGFSLRHQEINLKKWEDTFLGKRKD